MPLLPPRPSERRVSQKIRTSGQEDVRTGSYTSEFMRCLIDGRPESTLLPVKKPVPGVAAASSLMPKVRKGSG